MERVGIVARSLQHDLKIESVERRACAEDHVPLHVAVVVHLLEGHPCAVAHHGGRGHGALELDRAQEVHVGHAGCLAVLSKPSCVSVLNRFEGATSGMGLTIFGT